MDRRGLVFNLRDGYGRLYLSERSLHMKRIIRTQLSTLPCYHLRSGNP